MEHDLDPVISATRFVVPGEFSSYFGQSRLMVVDIYQDSKVVVRKETYKHGRVDRAELGQSVQTYIYSTVGEFKSAHPVEAKRIIEYLREAGLNLPWVESRSPDLRLKTHKCKMCGAVKQIADFPINDGAFSGVHDDCCDCRRAYCKREKCWCIAPQGDKCKTCIAREPI